MHTTCFEQDWSSHVSLKLLIKLLCFHPQVQFMGYVLVYTPMCPMVMGSSSYCIMYSCYECSSYCVVCSCYECSHTSTPQLSFYHHVRSVSL
jgi:hypothetical protein